MSTTVAVKGVNYTLASDGDKDYGAYMTVLINAMITAYNDTPVQTNVAQYVAVVSDVAARRTHATLEAVIADVAVPAGSNVLIDGATFAQAATLDISKKLYIYGLGNSTFQAAAGLGATPIIQFSVSGSRFQGIALDANALTPTYAIQVDAAVMDIALDVELIGAFATGDIDNQSTDEAIVGQVKLLTGNYLLPISSPGANSALSNLSSPTAVNEDIVYDTDNTYDFGSDALEAKTVWTHAISHNDAVDTALAIATTGNDGDIAITPNGTGRVILDTTVEIESGVIEETVGNLEITATGAGSDVTIDSDSGDIILDAGSDSYTIDKSGVAYEIPFVAEIIPYTTVNAPGTASQIQAGHIPVYTDLNTNLSACAVLAQYNFGAGAALVTDETGVFDLTNVNAVTNVVGGSILATDYAALFTVASTNYFHVNGLLDTPSGFTNNGIGVLCWVKFTDGQIATVQKLFHKINIAGEDYMYAEVTAAGLIQFVTEESNNGAQTLPAQMYVPNGATGYFPVLFTWDTTYGKRITIFGQNNATDPTQTTLMLDDAGAGTDFFIGANTTPGEYLGGTLSAPFIVMDATLSESDIEYLFAPTIPIPAVLQGTDFRIIEFKQPLGDATYARQGEFKEVYRSATNIYAKAYRYGSSDKIKLAGEVI